MYSSRPMYTLKANQEMLNLDFSLVMIMSTHPKSFSYNNMFSEYNLLDYRTTRFKQDSYQMHYLTINL